MGNKKENNNYINNRNSNSSIIINMQWVKDSKDELNILAVMSE